MTQSVAIGQDGQHQPITGHRRPLEAAARLARKAHALSRAAYATVTATV
jgi:hypothetical protein